MWENFEKWEKCEVLNILIRQIWAHRVVNYKSQIILSIL